MNLENRILQSIRPRKDGVLLRSDVGGFGSPSQVSVVLKSLCKKGLLVRLDRGVYAKPAKVAELGKSKVLAAGKLRGANLLADKTVIERKLHPTAVARYVDRLAKSMGVHFVPTFADRWAIAATRLAGDEIKSDATDDLLVALTRQRAITSEQMVRLLTRHHRALKRV